MVKAKIREFLSTEQGKRTAVYIFVPILFITLFLLFKMYAGNLYSRELDSWNGRLSAMADDRKASIESWLSERYSDADVIASNPNVLDHAARSYGYSGIYILDASGRIIGASRGSPVIDAQWMQSSHEVLAGRSDRKVDFRFLAPQKKIMVVFSVPVRAGGSAIGKDYVPSVPSGMVAISIDPGKWLYHLIGKEPVPTRSAETLLMRRESDRIVYLSPVRHADYSPLTFSIPLDERRIAAYFAVRGMEIFGEFIDYRGTPVFAATRKIAGTDWGMVVKIDRSEALEKYYRELLYAGSGIFVFLFMTAGIGYGILKRQRMLYYKELALREEKYHLLMEQAKDIVLFFNADFRIVEANKAALDAYGYSREEILSLTIIDLRAPDTRHLVTEQFMESLRNGLVFESVHVRKDGTEFPVLVSTRGAELNMEQYVVSIIHDDTERKRAEDALRESAKRYRMLFENMLEGFAYCRMLYDGGRAVDFMYIEVNSAFEQLTGLKDAAGRKVSEVIPGFSDSASELLEIYNRVALTGIAERCEVYLDALNIWFSISVYSTEKEYFIAVFDNITERKRAEEELRGYRDHLEDLVEKRTAEVFSINEQLKLEILEREQVEKSLFERESILRGFFDSSPFMMGVVELESSDIRHISDNKASAEFFKTTIQNMHRQFASDLGMPEQTIAEWIGRYREAKRLNQPVSFEYSHGEGESLRWLSATVVYISDDDARNPRFCYVVLDITNRKKTELELEIYHQNLEELVQDRTSELQRSNRDLEQFAYVASHDLQEPLRMISSYVQLLAKRYGSRLDEEADQFIAYAVDGATRMQTLINDLLAYSRVGTRGQPFTDVNVRESLDRAMSVLAIMIEDRKAVITIDPLPAIHADHSQLTQLFQNLLTNAVKFNTSARPTVHISAEKNEREWIFSIRDNGIGLDSEYNDRIFVIFQRLHKKDEYPGTGIGLSICKKIVERHGGRIWVDSIPGKGSTFYFSIPIKGGGAE